MSYERLETRKGCHAKLCEKADPLKALGVRIQLECGRLTNMSVAAILRLVTQFL